MRRAERPVSKEGHCKPRLYSWARLLSMQLENELFTSLQTSATAPGYCFSQVIKVCNGLICFCKEITLTLMIMFRNL